MLNGALRDIRYFQDKAHRQSCFETSFSLTRQDGSYLGTLTLQSHMMKYPSLIYCAVLTPSALLLFNRAQHCKNMEAVEIYRLCQQSDSER